MSIARVTLTIGNLSHDQSHALAEQIENDFRMDPLAVTINETDEAKAMWETVAWFESEELAREASAILALPHAMIAPVPDLDWVKRSLEGLAPVAAGRFFLHGSHDRHIRRAGGISLEIDAGTAFGTGHHGTTAGCLEALDDILKRHRPRHILDLGCGTGVLAIAASQALKTKSLATDIDAEAVRVSLNNAALNGVKPLLYGQTAAGLHHPSIRKSAPYNLIFANILARPLASLAPGLCAILAPGGHLILSGLTVDQKRWIAACYQNRGLRITKTIRHENWLAIVMVKPRKRKNPAPDGAGQLLGRLNGPGWEEA
ncbi:MAG: 50S ribosomal protein L11 methyltransferase [Alphaproteobacteria bacterium]|nr:50S ribosomal protein L11 methyltransferase [Alphaproteobacteria bacterium]